MSPESSIIKGKKESLWTTSFFILWQGQLVSTLGDAAYSVSLGFWVLAVTGSTALMGMLMAASTLPGVLVSPFAGVLIDRHNRKHLLILMDMIRGLSIVLVSAAAFTGIIAVWMVFVAGIILSICGAVFRPGVNSCVPYIVSTSKLSNANAMLSIASTGSNMLGNVAGGFLFQLLGAPFLFIFNGLSYLFSGVSLFFVNIPKNENYNKQNVWKDMSDGFHFMWKLKGLRYLLLIAAVLNFFLFIVLILLLPLFQRTPSLGAVRYGVAMACFMGGAMAGYVFLSVKSIPPNRKLKLFIISIVIFSISIIIAINQSVFVIMDIFLFIGGLFNSIANVILLSTVQAASPREMIGKVMAFMSMTTQGLTPFAMALGGVLAGFISIRVIISVSLFLVVIIIIPFYFVKSFKKFINYDYEKDIQQT
ncbi:MFS transporter (plasmid) [Clostridium estertheticum]|uniref:MFS transporter n=1 Tax=Clostridium estertheticum TaxID=238834 RepID=UPI001C0C244F|nr:MFS transporter [Clostridium estertheticum]MBU3217868.1 MFS transporter [Clostridium estertheticum]WAG58386.1 MFS transporter [Clostridium estertheticum]